MDITDCFYLYEYVFTWVFIAFAFCWGITSMIQQWDGFAAKLINSILIVGSVVFILLLMGYDWAGSGLGVLVGGAVALWIGNRLSNSVDTDWQGVFAIFGIIAFIVMFVLFGAEV